MKASRRVFARSNYFISFNEINFKITLKICPDCGNDFVLVYTHRWRCKEKLHSAHSTTQGNHDNDILHHTIENPLNSLVNLNNDIYSNHSEGHLTSYDFTCYCSKKCKGLRRLRAHQRSCIASNLDNLKPLFTQNNATCQQQTNYADEEPPSPQQEKIPVKDGIKLPTTKEEWETANTYFQAILDLHSDITDTEKRSLCASVLYL